MTTSEKQRKFSLMVARLIDFVYSNGMECTLGEAWRPQMMQDFYFKTGKSKVKYSTHQDRLAIDLNLFINEKYATNPEDYRSSGEYWESIGGRWGGRFGIQKEDYDKKVGWDSGHFEYGNNSLVKEKINKKSNPNLFIILLKSLLKLLKK